MYLAAVIYNCNISKIVHRGIMRCKINIITKTLCVKIINEKLRNKQVTFLK